MTQSFGKSLSLASARALEESRVLGGMDGYMDGWRWEMVWGCRR